MSITQITKSIKINSHLHIGIINTIHFLIGNVKEQDVLKEFILRIIQRIEDDPVKPQHPEFKQNLIVFYGSGCNGKTYLLNLIENLLGNKMVIVSAYINSRGNITGPIKSESVLTSPLVTTGTADITHEINEAAIINCLINDKPIVGRELIFDENANGEIVTTVKYPTCNVIFTTNNMITHPIPHNPVVINFRYNVPLYIKTLQDLFYTFKLCATKKDICIPAGPMNIIANFILA